MDSIHIKTEVRHAGNEGNGYIYDHNFLRSRATVRSAPPNPSIMAVAEGNSALDVELQDPPQQKRKRKG